MIVVVSVILIFTYAIASRLLHYYEYPSNIQVETGYLDKLPFPTVTVCNKNPYRYLFIKFYCISVFFRGQFQDHKSDIICHKSLC